MAIEMVITPEGVHFKVVAETVEKLFEDADLLSRIPKVCPKCAKPTYPAVRRTTAGTYYLLRCSGRPAHEALVRKHKDAKGGGLFFKDDEPFELEYSARQLEASGEQPAQLPPAGRETDEEREAEAIRGQNACPSDEQYKLWKRLSTGTGLSGAALHEAVGAKLHFDNMTPEQAGRFLAAVEKHLRTLDQEGGK
jgi:hypothetical protein